jgi:hypothetical protein
MDFDRFLIRTIINKTVNISKQIFAKEESILQSSENP